MDIYSLTIDNGEDVFYTKGFMDVLESHLNYFRSNLNLRVIEIQPKKADIYNGDLFGYLNELNISPQYHWLVMRINNYYCNSEFGPGKKYLQIPNNGELEQIRSVYTATGNIYL